jgi:hypothetical protein
LSSRSPFAIPSDASARRDTPDGTANFVVFGDSALRTPQQVDFAGMKPLKHLFAVAKSTEITDAT